MASDLADDRAPAPDLRHAGVGLRVAIVAGRFNAAITLRLLEGVRRGLTECGVDEADTVLSWVPGAFELPVVAKTYAETGNWQAVIAIGCVIRGDTAHFDFVAGQCAHGLQQVGLQTGVPTIFGVLTTETAHQAMVRSEGPGGYNVGRDSARTAVEMARLLGEIRGH